MSGDAPIAARPDVEEETPHSVFSPRGEKTTAPCARYTRRGCPLRHQAGYQAVTP